MADAMVAESADAPAELAVERNRIGEDCWACRAGTHVSLLPWSAPAAGKELLVGGAVLLQLLAQFLE